MTTVRAFRIEDNAAKTYRITKPAAETIRDRWDGRDGPVRLVEEDVSKYDLIEVHGKERGTEIFDAWRDR